jgi:hypothetical protein
MKSFLILLKKHWGILLFAAFVSGVMFLPQICLQQAAGTAYRGVFFSASDSELFYDAQVRDVYDGHYKLANAFLHEYKTLPYIIPPLPAIFLATLGRLAFPVADSAKILFSSRLFIPFLLAVCIYIFFYQLTRSRLYSILAAALVIFGLDFLQNFRSVFDFFRGHFVDNKPLAFSRTISPQVGVLFFFAYAALFWKWLTTGKKIYLFFSGIVLGLSFYVYFYTWAYILAANGFLGLYLLYKKSYARFWYLAAMHVLALALATPYFINLREFFKQPDQQYLIFYQGQILSREFSMNWTLVVGLVGLLFIKPVGFLRPWLFCLLAGGFLAINQQVITGRELQLGHFHWYFIAPMVGLEALLILYGWLGKKTSAIVAICLLIFLTFYAFAKQNYTYQSYKDSYVALQRYGEVYDWFNANTSKDTVVLVPDLNRADALAVYTHNDVFYANFMFLSNTPQERSQEMFFFHLYLSGVTADSAEVFFRTDPSAMTELLGSLPVRKAYGCLTCFPDSEYTRYAGLYKDFISQGPVSFIDKYRLDYVVWDKRTDTPLPGELLAKLQLEKSVGDFYVYYHRQNTPAF